MTALTVRCCTSLPVSSGGWVILEASLEAVFGASERRFGPFQESEVRSARIALASIVMKKRHGTAGSSYAQSASYEFNRSGSSVAPISFRCAIAFPVFLLTLFSMPFPLLAQTKVVFLTSGNSWTVPSDWNNANNTVEVIAAGGMQTASGILWGSGGGSYSRISNLALTPGSNVSYQIGISGQHPTTGGATWFNGTSVSNASVSAEGGCPAYTSAKAYLQYYKPACPGTKTGTNCSKQ